MVAGFRILKMDCICYAARNISNCTCVCVCVSFEALAELVWTTTCMSAVTGRDSSFSTRFAFLISCSCVNVELHFSFLSLLHFAVLFIMSERYSIVQLTFYTLYSCTDR